MPSRLLIHESIYDEVVDLLLPMLAGVKVGDPFEDDTLMGPVIKWRRLCSNPLDDRAGTR